MKVYTVLYREENELYVDIEANSGEEALQFFENMAMSGSIDFNEMETVDSGTSILYESDVKEDEQTFDDVIEAYEEYIDEHYDLDLGRENFIMSEDVLTRIVQATGKSVDEKIDLIKGLMIDNFIGDVIMDRAVHESNMSERAKEILDENWDAFQSWAFDLGVTVNDDELNAYLIHFVLCLMGR